MTSSHIIIVNYNAGQWLQRSVCSALEFSDGKITVVDNLSFDSSIADAQAVISSDRVSWCLNTENVGFAAANNQVLSELDCEFAILMNPDCELNENSLAPILKAMNEDPTIGLASCRILNEDGSLQTTCRRRFPTPWSAFVRMSQLGRVFKSNPKFADFDYGTSVNKDDPVEAVEAISGAFMVARMEAVRQVGLLDEEYFMHCEDLDWCKRFELQNLKVAFVPSASVLHVKGVSSQSRPVGVLYTLHIGMNRFFDKFYRTEYGLPLRLTVKLGIAMSFIARSSFALLNVISKKLAAMVER